MGTQHPGYRHWTPDEDDFVQQTRSDPMAVVADCLNRSVFSIQGRRDWLNRPDRAAESNARTKERNDGSRLNAGNTSQAWTADADEFVLSTLDDPLDLVAETLGRTVYATATHRYNLRRGVISRAQEQERVIPPGVEFGDVCNRCGLHHRGEC